MTKQTKISYCETASFTKDFKRLHKKFRTLAEDLDVAKIYAIELLYCDGIDNNSVFEIEGCCSESIKICKLKKFTCKALKGRGVKSGIRVIFAFHVDTYEVVFIEMYFKSDQENEDRVKIDKYLGEHR